MKLRLAAMTMFCMFSSGCAGYQALIIPRHATSSAPGALQLSDAVQVCERIGTVERRCTMMSRNELRDFLEQMRAPRY